MRRVRVRPANPTALAGFHGTAVEGRRAKRRRARRLESRAKRLHRSSGGKKRARRRQQTEEPPERRMPMRAMPRRPMRRRQQPAEEAWAPDVEESSEAFWDDEPPEDDIEWPDEDDELLEGVAVELGRVLPRGTLKRVLSRIEDRLEEGRGRRQGRRTRRTAMHTVPAAPAGQGPVVALGRNIRIQALNGHRAAVMPLRDGLWIVADVREEAVLPTTEGGFGLAPMLPALLTRAAANALRNRRERRAARRGEASPLSPSTSSALTLAGHCTWCEPGDLG